MSNPLMNTLCFCKSNHITYAGPVLGTVDFGNRLSCNARYTSASSSFEMIRIGIVPMSSLYVFIHNLASAIFLSVITYCGAAPSNEVHTTISSIEPNMFCFFSSEKVREALPLWITTVYLTFFEKVVGERSQWWLNFTIFAFLHNESSTLFVLGTEFPVTMVTGIPVNSDCWIQLMARQMKRPSKTNNTHTPFINMNKLFCLKRHKVPRLHSPTYQQIPVHQHQVFYTTLALKDHIAKVVRLGVKREDTRTSRARGCLSRCVIRKQVRSRLFTLRSCGENTT